MPFELRVRVPGINKHGLRIICVHPGINGLNFSNFDILMFGTLYLLLTILILFAETFIGR